MIDAHPTWALVGLGAHQDAGPVIVALAVVGIMWIALSGWGSA